MQEKILLYGFDTSYKSSLEESGYDVLSDELRLGYDMTIASSSAPIPFLTDIILYIADKSDNDDSTYLLLKDKVSVINKTNEIAYDTTNSFSTIIDSLTVKVSFLDLKEIKPLLLAEDGSFLAFLYKADNKYIYVFPAISPEKLPELLKILKQKKNKLLKTSGTLPIDSIPPLNLEEYETKRGEIIQNSERKLKDLEDRFESHNQRAIFLNKLISPNGKDVQTAIRLFLSFLGLELIEQRDRFLIFRSEKGLIACFHLVCANIPDTLLPFRKEAMKVKKSTEEPLDILIISNHQKYLPLDKRQILPASLIEEAENMHWGVISVKDIYLLDDNLNKGVLTKAWSRNQLHTPGRIDFSLKDDKFISVIKLVKRDDKHFCLITLDNKLVKKNMKVVIAHEDGSMDAARILSLKVNKVSMVEAMDGDVVIELDKEAVKGSSIFTV